MAQFDPHSFICSIASLPAVWYVEEVQWYRTFFFHNVHQRAYLAYFLEEHMLVLIDLKVFNYEFYSNPGIILVGWGVINVIVFIISA